MSGFSMRVTPKNLVLQPIESTHMENLSNTLPEIYALHLMKAFDIWAKDANVIKFNCSDLYGVVTGKRGLYGHVSDSDIDSLPIDSSPTDAQIKAAENVSNGLLLAKQAKKNLASFMEEVADCLIGTDLCSEYGGRDLLIKQYDGAIWIAVDVSRSTVVEIDF